MATDDPRNRPPPLPPRPLVAEPFLRSRSTPPDGGLKSDAVVREVLRGLPRDPPRDEGRYASYDPRDRLIADMRQEIDSLRLLSLRAPDPETADTEPPPTRPSERVRRAKQAKAAAVFTGKWTFLLTALPFIGAAVAKKWPEYSELVNVALQLVGLR